MSKAFSGVFITGTDTNCGKTIIAGGVARVLLRKGFNVGIMKPVATAGEQSPEMGGRPRLMSDDALHLRQAAATSDSLDLINPVCFKAALAPWPAARYEKKTVDLKRIMNAFRELEKRHDFLVVEGIGGLKVPIKRDFFVSDLIFRMHLPVIIVANPEIGMINHTLLTIGALKQEGIPLCGVIINNYQGRTRAEKTNPNVLQKIIKRRVIVVPHLPRLRTDFDTLARHLEKGGLLRWPYLP